MRIWILNHHAEKRGRHFQFARWLVQQGHQVTLMSASYRHQDYKETQDYRDKKYIVEQEEGLSRVWVRTPLYRGDGFKRLLNHLVFARRAEKFSRRLDAPDVIIGSSGHLFAAQAAARLADYYHVPFVFEVRELWPQVLMETGAVARGGIAARFLESLEQRLLEKADRVVTLLPGAQDYLVSRGVEPSHLAYIPNGVSLDWFDFCASLGPEPSLRQFFQDHSGRFVVTYTGSMRPANGLETLITAAAILQEKGDPLVHILLAGDGPRRRALENQARSLGLQNITFWPRLEKDQLPALLKQSSACLFHLKKAATHRYGISASKVFEYLASSRPLIYAHSGSTDIAGAARCGPTIPAEDPQAMAAAMLMLAGLPAYERERLGRNGRLYVEAYHDIPHLARRFQAVLYEAVARVPDINTSIFPNESRCS